MKFDKCKAWIVDPEKKIITTEDIRVDDGWDSIRKIIGCEYLEYVPLHAEPPVVVLCDENGRLKEGKKNFFHYRWFGYTNDSNNSMSLASITDTKLRKELPVYEHTFCGKIVFFGYSRSDGELRDIKMNLKEILEGIELCNDDYVDEPRMEFISLNGKDLH